MELKAFDPTYDYTKDIDEDDIRIEEGKQFVYLRGLEKLAKLRGIISATCVHLFAIPTGTVCTYRYTFKDGGVYDGSADATTKNCDGNFALYTTAMAESRAKARALRTAFGISLCSVEEKSSKQIKDDVDLGPIEEHQIVAIKHIAKTNNMDKAQVFSLLEIQRNVERLEDLSKEEGRQLIISLNSKTKRKSTLKKD